MDQAKEKRSRLRQASERLYEDTRLRSALDDSQAERLLSWGMEQIEREVERTAFLPGEEAAPLLEQQATAVREVISRINHLMDGYEGTNERRRRDQIARLVEALCRVKSRRLQVGDMMALEALSNPEHTGGPDTFFQTLLDVVVRDVPGDDALLAAATEEE